MGGPCRSTSLAPNSFTCTVTSGPVSWFGVGWRIWMRASVAGRGAGFGPADWSLEQPVRARSRSGASRAAREDREPRMRLMVKDDTARSPVLGRTARSPVPDRLRRAAPAAHGQGARRRQQGDDAGGQGRLGRAVVGAAGFRLRRRGGAGGDGRGRGPGGSGPGRPRGGGVDVDLDVVGLPVSDAWGHLA